jgi:hypothetical protein
VTQDSIYNSYNQPLIIIAAGLDITLFSEKRATVFSFFFKQKKGKEKPR